MKDQNRRMLNTANEMPMLGAQLRKYLEAGPAEVRWKRPESERTIEQNDKMWAMLDDIAKQVVWYGKKLADYEWKDVFSAAIKKQEAVPGIDGGFVILGARTSRMSIRLMSDLIELMYAFGSDPEHPVHWTDPKVIAQMQAMQKEAA